MKSSKNSPKVSAAPGISGVETNALFWYGEVARNLDFCFGMRLRKESSDIFFAALLQHLEKNPTAEMSPKLLALVLSVRQKIEATDSIKSLMSFHPNAQKVWRRKEFDRHFYSNNPEFVTKDGAFGLFPIRTHLDFGRAARAQDNCLDSEESPYMGNWIEGRSEIFSVHHLTKKTDRAFGGES